MAELPKTLEQAIAKLEKQPRLQSQMVIPAASRVTVSELKPMPVAEQFLPAFDSIGSQLKVFFSRCWCCCARPSRLGRCPFKILDIGTERYQ